MLGLGSPGLYLKRVVRDGYWSIYKEVSDLIWKL
jgi:hypothetical protein